MSAVSNVLLATIKELQGLPSLQNTSLGGGTSVALRYGHRKSVDIDLVFAGCIGRKGFETIEKEVRELYKEAILALDYPCNEDDQYIFLRFVVRREREQIKVEVMQNMCMMDEPDIIDGIRVLSLSDIGMLKLMAACNRCSFKDIYDLHYITEELKLPDLLNRLKEKQSTYSNDRYKTIFDLDNEVSPVDDPKRLLKFDEESMPKTSRPSHSTNRFDIVNGISWLGAKSLWRRKVKDLFRQLGIA